MVDPIYREQDLVAALKTGQRQAFSELYDRYAPNMLSVLIKLTQSEADAENLLQDTFVKVWRNIHSYDAAKGRLYTWLITITRRVALDFMRSSYFSERLQNQPVDSAVAIHSQDEAMDRLNFLGIEKPLANLEPNLRSIIEMQYFRGYTQQEIADETGLPLGTVKTRTRTALLTLRKQLENV